MMAIRFSFSTYDQGFESLNVCLYIKTKKTRVDVKRNKFMEQMNERDRETDLAKNCDRWFDGCS